MKLTLHENQTNKFLYGDTRYSTFIGRNILSKVIKNLGVEVLFQFWFNKQRIERMLDKGLLGKEVDLVSSIRAARANFDVKFLKERERKLLQNVFLFFSEHFYIKPVCMLTLNKSLSWRHLSAIKKKSYEEVIFDGQYRPVIDRTAINDWLIFLIAELYKMSMISEEVTLKLLEEDVASDDSTPWRIFYERFSYMKLDTAKGCYATTLLKKWKEDLIKWIRSAFSLIQTEYRAHGINNVQDYVTQMSGHIRKKKRNHSYVNFAWHGKLPNIYLQSLRNQFKSLLTQQRDH